MYCASNNNIAKILTLILKNDFFENNYRYKNYNCSKKTKTQNT